MSGDSHSTVSGFAVTLFAFAAVGLVGIFAYKEVTAQMERNGKLPVVYGEPPRTGFVPTTPAGGTGPASQQGRTPPVPTTVHSSRIGAPAPAQPLPNHVKSPACSDPRAERRINPDTGKRSCFVPD